VKFDFRKSVGSDFFVCHQPRKMFKGTVIHPFRIRGKTAARQLPAFQMVTEAFAA